MDKKALAEALRTLGVRKDSVIIVHSSLKSFGHMEGGAEAVVDAFMEVVTEGTLIFPSFNHGAPYDRGEVFDIRKTPTTNGAIPDAFWRRPGVKRSMNPTHAFAVYGKDAEKIASAHETAPAVGVGSPLDYLYKNDGSVVLLGVCYNRNTFHHYVETVLCSPCLYARGEEYDVIDENGEKKRARTWSWREKSCPIDDPAKYAPFMEKYEKTMMLGTCKITYFKVRDCFEVVEKCLTEGLDGCPGCAECPIRPRVCEFSVPDEEE